MKIDFPNPKDEMNDIPPEIVVQEYHFLMDMFKRKQKHQFNQNYLYLKFMGLFILISVIYFVLQRENILVNFLIGTTVVGVGTLCSMLSIALFLDPQRDREVAKCIKAGKFIETKYSETIPTKLFHRFEELQSNCRLGVMLSRFGSFSIVLILTASSSISLSMNVSSWFAVSVGIFSGILLIFTGIFFNMVIKKNFK